MSHVTWVEMWKETRLWSQRLSWTSQGQVGNTSSQAHRNPPGGDLPLPPGGAQPQRSQEERLDPVILQFWSWKPGRWTEIRRRTQHCITWDHPISLRSLWGWRLGVGSRIYHSSFCTGQLSWAWSGFRSQIWGLGQEGFAVIIPIRITQGCLKYKEPTDIGISFLWMFCIFKMLHCHKALFCGRVGIIFYHWGNWGAGEEWTTL